jgi:hypothetical protein
MNFFNCFPLVCLSSLNVAGTRKRLPRIGSQEQVQQLSKRNKIRKIWCQLLVVTLRRNRPRKSKEKNSKYYVELSFWYKFDLKDDHTICHHPTHISSTSIQADNPRVWEIWIRKRRAGKIPFNLWKVLPEIRGSWANQEASGLTGFVRCLDIKKTSSGLDISPGARFHQCLMFWQYPHLPWLNLIHCNVKTNNSYKLGEEETQSMLTVVTDSLRNLFQLLRARQCPYFYVFANTF